MISKVLDKVQSSAKNKEGDNIVLKITEKEWIVITEALIKQKPLFVNFEQQSEYARQKTAPCRICRHILLMEYHKYCPTCGQKARWE